MHLTGLWPMVNTNVNPTTWSCRHEDLSSRLTEGWTTEKDHKSWAKVGPKNARALYYIFEYVMRWPLFLLLKTA